MITSMHVGYIAGDRCKLMRILLLAWIYSLLISGCMANYPNDVALVSVKVVDYREQPELPTRVESGSTRSIDPYRDFLLALSKKKGNEPITPSDIDVYFVQQSKNEFFKNSKQNKPLLKIEFTSKENLHEYTRSKHYPLSIVPYFCKRPGSTVSLGGPLVFWRGLEIGGPLNYAIQQKKGESLTYYAFLNVVYDFAGPSSYEHFDLRTNPEDVCFQLRGGSTGFGFESNVVEIPNAEIVKALMDLPPTLRAKQ